jgi:D-amino-acid oxidase
MTMTAAFASAGWRMQAAQPPPPPPSPAVCVVGAGVIGLTAAHRLAAAGFDVTVVARETVHSAAAAGGRAAYTSVNSGGLWWPFHIEPADKVQRWAAATYREFVAQRERCGNAIGVSLVPGFLLNATVREPEMPWFAGLTGMELVDHGTDSRVPEQYASAFRMTTTIVEADVYLRWLHACLEGEMGVRFVTKLDRWDFEFVKDFARRRLGVAAIVNCTGMGAAEIDNKVTPGRGVLLFGKRSAATEGFTGYWMTEQEHDGFLSGGNDLVYAFPRGNSRVLLGGTIGEPDDMRDTATDEEIAGVRRRVGTLVPALQDVEEDCRWAGFRPLREGGVRLEQDPDERDLWHLYGHGGGGFTTAWGCADEMLELLSLSLRA